MPLSAAPSMSPQTFTITAYCHHGITKSGVPAQSGVAAADPVYLPMGSVVDVLAAPPEKPQAGTYTVLDTGAKVKGRHLDLFTPDCNRAIQFGRQLLRVIVLRFGWHSHVPIPHRPL